MQKACILIAILLNSISLSAQSIKIPVGKKFQVVTDMKTVVSVSAMGQSIDAETNNSNTAEYEISAVTDNGYSMRTTVNNVKSSNKIGGIEKNFDSDNESDRNDATFAEAAKLVGKPTEITIENGVARITSGEIMAFFTQIGLKDNNPELVKFILYRKDLDACKKGYQWTDSIKNNQMDVVNESVVTGITDTEIEIQIKSLMTIHTTIQQMGMEAKASFHGLINSRRWYNRNTGVLIKEEGDTDMAGDTEIMDQKIPMNMKMKSSTTVK